MNMVSLKKKWVSTDPWRGYEEYDNSVADGCFLAMNPSQNQEEKERINKIKSTLKKNKIPHRLAYGRTSNVFSTAYDIVVDKKNVGKAKKLLKGVV